MYVLCISKTRPKHVLSWHSTSYSAPWNGRTEICVRQHVTIRATGPTVTWETVGKSAAPTKVTMENHHLKGQITFTWASISRARWLNI